MEDGQRERRGVEGGFLCSFFFIFSEAESERRQDKAD